jgi:hypothetical protein
VEWRAQVLSVLYSYACQKAFGHLNVCGVGRGTGEPAEIFNSVLGPHGHITRYMNPATREAHLERITRLHCRDVVLGLPSRLWRMRARAKAVLGAGQRRIDNLEDALARASGTSVEEVRQSLELNSNRSFNNYCLRSAGPAADGGTPVATPCCQLRCRWRRQLSTRAAVLRWKSSSVRTCWMRALTVCA